jgi:hypothetical protein
MPYQIDLALNDAPKERPRYIHQKKKKDLRTSWQRGDPTSQNPSQALYVIDILILPTGPIQT